MRNLVIGMVGKESCHRQWITRPHHKKFDLVLVSYDGTDYSQDCDNFFLVNGFKYDTTYKLFTENHLDITTYDAVMLLDDDLSMSTEQINTTFQLFHEHSLWLAQPSLTHISYYSHSICLQDKERKLRYTNFVECMCPVFSKYALDKVLSTFNEAPMGTAIDWVWPMLLEYPTDRIAIIDAVAITHTRPVRGEYSVYNFDDRSYYTEIREKYNPPLWGNFKVFSSF